jgi:DNA-binding MarR family transcriptional regulator
MVQRRQPADTPADQAAREAEELRIAGGIREIRRGSSMLRIRALVLGAGASALEMGQADALAAICDAGRSRMRELADALRVDASTATRAVERLERTGLVKRETARHDGRVVHVVPTRRGLAEQSAMKERYQQVMHHVCSGFDDEELAALAGLLERLVAGLDAVAAGPIEA